MCYTLKERDQIISKVVKRKKWNGKYGILIQTISVEVTRINTEYSNIPWYNTWTKEIHYLPRNFRKIGSRLIFDARINFTDKIR